MFFILSIYLLFYILLLWRAWYQNVFQQDSRSKLEPESSVNNSLKIKSIKYNNCWLPPIPITDSRFNAIVTNVDMQCMLYLQNKDEGIQNTFKVLYFKYLILISCVLLFQKIYNYYLAFLVN